MIAAGIAALFSTVFLLAGPSIYSLLGGRGTMLAAALEYSNVIFAGAIAYWMLGALTSVVRATGQVAILAYVYAAAEVLHIALVPALVFGPEDEGRHQPDMQDLGADIDVGEDGDLSGCPHHARERAEQPVGERAGEDHVGIFERRREDRSAAAQQAVDRGARRAGRRR